MKYQSLASLGATIFGLAATVSASPLVKRDGSCPSGYTQSIYYETIAIAATSASSSTPAPAPVTTTSTSTSSVASTTSTTSTYIATSAPTVDAASTTSSSPSVAPVPETTVIPTQEHVVVHTSTSEAPQEPTTTTAPVEPSTTSSAVEETTSSTSSTSTSSTAAAATTTASSSGSETSGTATYYGGNVSGGTCSFSDYTLPSSLYGTALSIDQWDNAANCGACVAVTGPNGKTVKAMIVDECPSCATNHFDLFENAFGEIAEISAGVIDIDWEFTSCDLSGPLKVRNKSGTSEYWFSMQVVNANEPVTKFEVSTDSGSTWQSTTRTSYNYFENSSGFGVDTVDVRVTGKSGATVVVKNVSASSTSDFTASSNL